MIIDQLDLVISVDSPVAHMAGALGKQTWTLLSHGADWRWMLEGETTPWYPTMRLFRQTQPGDWSGVIERVTEELSSQKLEGRMIHRRGAGEHRVKEFLIKKHSDLSELGGREKKSPRLHREVVYRRKCEF